MSEDNPLIVEGNKWWERPDLQYVKPLRFNPAHAPLTVTGVSGLVGLVVEARNILGPGRHTMVELGSWSGESAAIWAGSRLFSEITLVDLWREKAHEALCEYRMRRFQDTVRMVKGDMFKIADTIEDGSLDMVYLDADHTLEATRKVLPIWSRKVRPGGIVAGHDFNEQHWPGVVQGVREFFGREPMLFEDTSWLYTQPIP